MTGINNKLLVDELTKLPDWGMASLHDAVFEATTQSLDEPDLLVLLESLPSALLLDALKWGLSDTQVRDDIYEIVKYRNVQ